MWGGPRRNHRRNHRTQEPTLTLTLTARRNFVTNEEAYGRLVTDFNVVVDGENVGYVKGGWGGKGCRKGGEVVEFFLEAGLRSVKTQAAFEKLPDWKQDELESVGKWEALERSRCRQFKPLSAFRRDTADFEEKLR